jgi:acetyltransferase-like isoleucine patch superfamily enzyme
MQIIREKRSLWQVIRGIWIRTISVIAYVSFPTYFTSFLHRIRGVHVGKKTRISRFVFIDDRNPSLIHIGRGVAISAGTMILGHQRDLTHYKPGMHAMDNPLVAKKVVIDDGVHIGIGAIILPGVTIGQGAIIGAGAVVTRDVPPYAVAVGSPARIVRYFGDQPEPQKKD